MSRPYYQRIALIPMHKTVAEVKRTQAYRKDQPLAHLASPGPQGRILLKYIKANKVLPPNTTSPSSGLYIIRKRTASI
jgi:hypothetical protein